MGRKAFIQRPMASKMRQTSKKQIQATVEPASPVQHSNPDYQESEDNGQPSQNEPEPKIARKTAQAAGRVVPAGVSCGDEIHQ